MPARKSVPIQNYSFGRRLRTVIGGIVVLADVVAFSVAFIFIPIVTKTAPSFLLTDVAGHIGYLGLGVLLIDRSTGLAVIDHLVTKVMKK